MEKDKLKSARLYESIYSREISPAERPVFHLSTLVGWLNDPNGFSVYKGEYHLFYQYHPYNTNWGPMHWGHAKSKDLLHWQWLPAALAPDQEYDNAGCFSGSAIELPDGRHLLLYTGVQSIADAVGREVTRQIQCAALGNGVDYQKYEKNPVLDEEDLPRGGSSVDFRDPKLWREPDGSYRAVAANMTEDGSAAVRLFRSEDGLHWVFDRTLVRCENRIGKMWECPDYFALDGQQVLIVSPMEMEAQGLSFHNGCSTVSMLGQENQEGEFVWERVDSLDYGLDFYAPQTLLTQDGRRILIAWMQRQESCRCQPPGAKWFGQMTLPRELSIRDGRLIQTPIRELERLRKATLHWSGEISGSFTIPGVQGRVTDLTLRLQLGAYHHFTIQVAADDKVHTDIIHNSAKHTVTIDRTFSGFRFDILHRRSCEVHSGAVELRLILDRFSVEVFVNGGEQVLTSTLYTDQSAQGIRFVCDGTAKVELEQHFLEV